MKEVRSENAQLLSFHIYVISSKTIIFKGNNACPRFMNEIVAYLTDIHSLYIDSLCTSPLKLGVK